MKNLIETETENGIISVNTENIPDIIAGKIEEISALEKEVNSSEASAKKAMNYVNNQMERYEVKGKWIFKHRSGNTKDIIEDTQEAIEQLAAAQQVSVKALKKSFEFQKKLAETSKYLFELGCANITVNRIAVRAIEAKMKGATKGEISELAHQEMMAVVRQLKEQEDILKKQEFLNSQVKKHTARLDEKDKIDTEQNERLEELGTLLNNKDVIDQKQEDAIKKNAKSIKILFDYTKQKDILDKEQSKEIQNLKKSSSTKLWIVSIAISTCALILSIVSIVMKFL